MSINRKLSIVPFVVKLHGEIMLNKKIVNNLSIETLSIKER